MPVIYVLDIPEYEPVARIAEAGGMRAERLGDYVKFTSPAPEILLERRHADPRLAIWYTALTGGMEGRIEEFTDDTLRIVDER